jgi:hypothetical protein
MVTTIIDVPLYVDAFIHVLHHDFILNVIDIRSPVGNAIVKILGIKRSIIRDVVGVVVTDANTGIVSASTKAENCRAK